MVLLAAGTVVAWAATNEPAQPRMMQQDYYQLATRSQYGVFSTYPKPRRVVTDPVHKTYLGLAIDYAKSVNNRQVECGGYDCRTRTVCIKNEFVCAEAGLPDKLRPQFVHALRHEYGHALTQDLLTVKYAAKPMANKSYQTLDEANQPREISRVSVLVAPPLKPVVKDWQAAPSTIYGLEHNTDCFSEYLAESYARFLEGKTIPDATKRFLQSQSEPGKN